MIDQKLTVRVRTFKPFYTLRGERNRKPENLNPGGHPDFRNVVRSKDGDVEIGIVESHLSADKKPIYTGPEDAAPNPDATTHGRKTFDQWYRDVPGVNTFDDYILQFDMILAQKLPKLDQHMKKLGFHPVMYCIEWFTTMVSARHRTARCPPGSS